MDYSSAPEYVRCGLADTLMYKDQVLDYLKTMSGMKDEKESLRTVTLAEMVNVKDKEQKNKSKNKTAWRSQAVCLI